MCSSEVMGLTSCSTKTGSKDFANSPSSSHALRNLGKPVDSEDEEEDDLARLLNENGEPEMDEFPLLSNPCNGFGSANTRKNVFLEGLPNAAFQK